jgi:hypothetical protein
VDPLRVWPRRVSLPGARWSPETCACRCAHCIYDQFRFSCERCDWLRGRAYGCGISQRRIGLWGPLGPICRRRRKGVFCETRSPVGWAISKLRNESTVPWRAPVAMKICGTRVSTENASLRSRLGGGLWRRERSCGHFQKNSS